MGVKRGYCGAVEKEVAFIISATLDSIRESDGGITGSLASMDLFLLYRLPIWVNGVFFVVVLLAAVEVGYRAGFRQRAVWKDAEAGGGNVVLTSMFGLLSLILAFTFAAGVSRYEHRKQSVIADANALGTAFLRADMVAEPSRTELKKALFDYARARAIKTGKAFDQEQNRKFIQQSSRAQAKLWPAIRKILGQKQPSPIETSLVAAVNDIIDIHTVRIAAFFDRLPRIVLVTLVFIAATSLAVAGFNAGISGRMSRWRMTAVALVLAWVMLVILDFDRPSSGFIRVSQESIHAVIAEMEADLAQ